MICKLVIVWTEILRWIWEKVQAICRHRGLD